ncbi:MAG: glycosyltransferase [bacterium]|nr:glycosyltransferase [bacterium]
MNRRILYVVTKGTWGGAAKYVYDLATGLPERFDVHVAMGVPGELTERLNATSVTTHILKSVNRDVSLSKDTKTFFELVWLIHKLRPQIVHLNSSKMGLAALAARILRVPCVVFTVHGWPFFEDRNIIARALIWFFSWITALISHRVIVISRRDQLAARTMPLVWKKTRLIYNGVNISTPLEHPRQELAELIGVSLKQSDRVIGTIGEYTRNKGHAYLIDAFAQLKKEHLAEHLVIISDGELRSSYETKIRELKLSDCVHLVGTVLHADRFLPAFNVVAMSSVKEGLPYVLIEAGMQGVPIVASDVGGIRELITFDGGIVAGILVRPKNTNELHEALQQAISEGTILKPELFKERFAKDQMIQKTSGCYAGAMR